MLEVLRHVVEGIVLIHYTCVWNLFVVLVANVCMCTELPHKTTVAAE